jgi:elongation factor Ts
MTTTFTAQDVKMLRDRTGAGMMDCKKALTETGGNLEKAIDLLRATGAAKAAKRAERSANQGAIGSYIHHDGRTAVIVEVNCETDFVANTDDFKALAKDLAMHIASSAPLAVSPADIPAEVVERERGVYSEQVKAEGKPEQIAQKIIDGKLQKFFKENTLLAQPFVKDPERTIEQRASPGSRSESAESSWPGARHERHCPQRTLPASHPQAVWGSTRG